MIYMQIIGYVAGVFTTFSFLPQVVRIWKMKEARDISFWAYFSSATGAGLWFIYGIAVNQPPIWVANGVALFFVVLILISKIKYG